VTAVKSYRHFVVPGVVVTFFNRNFVRRKVDNISIHGINAVNELIYNRVEKFRISYGAADNHVCRLIARC